MSEGGVERFIVFFYFSGFHLKLRLKSVVLAVFFFLFLMFLFSSVILLVNSSSSSLMLNQLLNIYVIV